MIRAILSFRKVASNSPMRVGRGHQGLTITPDARGTVGSWARGSRRDAAPSRTRQAPGVGGCRMPAWWALASAPGSGCPRPPAMCPPGGRTSPPRSPRAAAGASSRSVSRCAVASARLLGIWQGRGYPGRPVGRRRQRDHASRLVRLIASRSPHAQRPGGSGVRHRPRHAPPATFPALPAMYRV